MFSNKELFNRICNQLSSYDLTVMDPNNFDSYDLIRRIELYFAEHFGFCKQNLIQLKDFIEEIRNKLDIDVEQDAYLFDLQSLLNIRIYSHTPKLIYQELMQKDAYTYEYFFDNFISNEYKGIKYFLDCGVSEPKELEEQLYKLGIIEIIEGFYKYTQLGEIVKEIYRKDKS